MDAAIPLALDGGLRQPGTVSASVHLQDKALPGIQLCDATSIFSKTAGILTVVNSY